MINTAAEKREMVVRMRKAAGFSLVEIMVAMVIGLVTTIVIMQSFAAFEGQKRTTTTSSDTLGNGLIALQAIEGDARMAGHGLVTPKGLACISMKWYEDSVSGTSLIAPVIVADSAAASGVSDTVTFTYATSPIAGTPSKLNADMPDAMADPDIDNSVGFTIDQDLFLAVAPIASPGTSVAQTPCVRLAYTSSSASPVAIYNSSDPNFFPVGGYPANSGFVINIGSGLNGAAGFVRTQYGPSNNDLLMTDVSHMGAAGAPQNSIVLASNIVNIQAQYGVASANSNPGNSSPAISCWTDATGNGCASGSGDWANPNASDIMRIKAIRLAVVARSTLQEKPNAATGACDASKQNPDNDATLPAGTWRRAWVNDLTAFPGSSSGPVIDLSAIPNWQCYRYRVYETVIPLRNVVWANI